MHSKISFWCCHLSVDLNNSISVAAKLTKFSAFLLWLGHVVFCMVVHKRNLASGFLKFSKKILDSNAIDLHQSQYVYVR